MYPLLRIGPFSLSTGGLTLLLALYLAGWLLGRIALARGTTTLAAQSDALFYPTAIGALIGARLFYGLFNLDVYRRTVALFWALRVGDLAWPGALLGGMLVAFLWGRWRGFDLRGLADSAALALPPAQALGSVGLLLSGEAIGLPTTLPWGVPLLGALRHPTQIYFALAALLLLGVLCILARRAPRTGALWTTYLGGQGLILLLVEALRADSLLLPGGVRVAQVVGLALLIHGLWWARQHAHDTAAATSRESAADSSLHA